MNKAEAEKKAAEERLQQQKLQQQQYLAKLIEQEAQLNIHNRQKVNELVRQRLRQTKTQQLRQDVEQINQDFERNVERKDACVALQARYVSIAEDQRKRALQSHSSIVSELLQLLNERMDVFSRDAEDDIARLKAQFDQELEALKEVYSVREDVQQQIREATLNEEEELIQQLKTDYKQKLDEINNQNREQQNITQLRLQEANTDLETLLLTEHENYKNATEAKQHSFKILLIKDQQSSNIIEENKIKLEKLLKQINHWKAKIQQTTEEFREKNFLLKTEKDEAQKEFNTLKHKLLKFRKEESQRQKLLVSQAHDAEDKILNLQEQAERIIRLSILCGRLETEAERVNEIERLDQEERAKIEKEVEQMKQQDETWPGTHCAESQEAVIKGVKELNFVYKKLSNATIDRLALQREQSLLERENHELREALQRFLSVGTVGGV